MKVFSIPQNKYLAVEFLILLLNFILCYLVKFCELKV